MKDVFRVWSVTNILEWRVAPRGWIVTQQVLLVLLTVGGHPQKQRRLGVRQGPPHHSLQMNHV